MKVNENESLQKNELIAKLEEISALYRDSVVIKTEMNNFEPVDNYDRKIVVPVFPGEYEDEEDRENFESAVDPEDEDAIEEIAAVYDEYYCPKEPIKPKFGPRPQHEPNLVKELIQKKGWKIFVSGFVAICSLISGGLFSGDFVTIIANIVILAICAIIILRFYKKYKSLEKADQEVTRLTIEGYEDDKKRMEEKYEQDMKVYKSNLTSYKLSRADFIGAYTEWRELYLESLKEEEKIQELLENDREEGVKQIYEEKYIPTKDKLDTSNDLISERYLPVINIIIDLLKSNRAENLKEAINLYEDIVYRERQLQLQREQEEQRRREEAQRRADEERRYQEEKKFREQQEYQRQYEEERRQREEERRHREEMKLQEQQERNRQYEERKRLEEERRRNEREARTAAANRQKRCMYCAYQTGCGVKTTEGAYNCTGFRPK